MAIDIKSWDMDRVTYAVVPEQVLDTDVSTIKSDIDMQKDGHGWTKDRGMRKIGEIPFSVYWNYYFMHCDDRNKISLTEFYEADNKKQVKNLLNEFTVFRVDDTPLGQKGAA